MYHHLLYTDSVHRLFLGCDWPLNIGSIRVIGNACNFTRLVTAITTFDRCLSGDLGMENAKPEMYTKAVQDLFAVKL